MEPLSHLDLLNQAAESWGIQPHYHDIWGNRHETSAETKQAILQALGVPAGDPESLARAIQDRKRREWTRILPPCAVLSAHLQPRAVPLQIPESAAGQIASFEIVDERGFRMRSRVNLRSLPTAEEQEIDGIRYLRKLAPVPEVLGLGYHQVHCFVEGLTPAAMRLILTPDRAWLPEDLRTAGVAVSLFGVRSARNWGCGDFRDLRDLVDWSASEVGAGLLGLNPLHAIHNRQPYNTSPYLPNCVFFRNFLYLDVEAIEDFQLSDRARKLWKKPETQQALEALRASELVQYEEVAAWKLRFLKLAFGRFLREEWRQGSPRAKALKEFIRREGDLLERFATHAALDEWIHRRNPEIWIWPDWPESYQDPNSAETRSFRDKHWRSVLFYQYLQWQIDLQLERVQHYARQRGLSLGLYHDLALATDRCGADLWAYRDFFVSGCRVGSPPDDFAPKGQDWAFPPPASERHYENGYRLFAETIRNNARHGGALRIDHVMRFFRLYWIPDGRDATGGAYVRDRWEDLLRILALESVRNRFVVVGEDLGTVEPDVREALARFGILSYRLFYFERTSSGGFVPFHDYPEQALISSTTHDLPTFAGFWVGEDLEARRRAGLFPDEATYWRQREQRQHDKQRMLDVLFELGLLPPSFPRSAADVPELTGDLHNAVVGFLALSPSRILLINQEDLTKEIAQQNLPGTTWQYPNWRRKMRFSIEQLRTEPLAHDFAVMLRHWLERSGRR